MTTHDRRSGVDVAVPARWVTAFFDPLTPLSTRLRLEHQMLVWVRQNGVCASAWFAGMLWQVVATLPRDDPWWALGVRGVEGVGVDRGVTPGGVSGVWGADGVKFGSLDSARDVVFPSHPDPRLDPVLSPLVEGLDEFAGGVLALAFDGWEGPFDVLSRVVALGDEGADRVLAAGSAALRWAVWRRRVYVGRTDFYPLMVAQAWLGRALTVVSGGVVDVSGCVVEVGVERVDEGSWAELHSLAQPHPFFPPGV